MFEESDFVIGNLETPLAGRKAPYSKRLFAFNSPDEFAGAMAAAGIDLVSTANNHCMDQDFEGMVYTLDVLDAYNIAHTGTWRKQEDRKEAYYFEKNNQRIAILAWTYGTNYLDNHYGLSEDKEKCINLLRPYKESVYIGGKKKRSKLFLWKKIKGLINLETRILIKKKLHMAYNTPRRDDYVNLETCKPYLDLLQNDIRKAKEKADVVLFYPHIGGQFNELPGKFTDLVVERSIQAGVSCVIGTHPHIIQKADIIGKIPVFYSLGNFSMSPNSVYLIHDHMPEYGLAVHVYIKRNRISAVSFSILKIMEKKDMPLTVFPMDQLYKRSNAEEQERMKSDVKKIYERVAKRPLSGPIIRKEYYLIKG